MPHLITIPIALLEIVIEYALPNMRLLVDRASVVERLFEAFAPWNVKLDDVEVITEGKPSEQGIKFKIPANRTSFMFGAGSCKLNRDDADWDSTKEIIEILNSGYKVLMELGSVRTGYFKTTIALHLQPKTTQFVEILKPLVSPQLLSLDSSTLKATASVVNWGNRRVTIDGSSQLANGLFLRFEREFAGTSTYEDIAHQLIKDEQELFALLDVEEDKA